MTSGPSVAGHAPVGFSRAALALQGAAIGCIGLSLFRLLERSQKRAYMGLEFYGMASEDGGPQGSYRETSIPIPRKQCRRSTAARAPTGEA